MTHGNTDPSGTTAQPRDLVQCGVCQKFYADWVQLVGQPVRCIHCLANALEKAQQALAEDRRVDPVWAKLDALAQRLVDIGSPPPPCTGAGLMPPVYQGVTMSGGTHWEPAPCAICGQVVAVDNYQHTVNHPYRPVTP